MKGSDFIAALPKDFGKVYPGEGCERDLLILEFIKAHGAVVHWFPLVVEIGNTSASFLVTNALQVGEPGDSVRVSMSQLGQQQVADHLNSVLFTKALADEHYRQSTVKIAAPARAITSSTAAMLDQSRKIDAAVAKKTSDPTGQLIGNEGKFWINHSKLFKPDLSPTLNVYSKQPNGCNYGWYGKPGGLYQTPTNIAGINCIQPAATFHDYYHVDYSQLVYLVARPVLYCMPKPVTSSFADVVAASGGDVGNYTGNPCTLPNGEEGEILDVDIYEAISDPELRKYFTKGDETLPYMRHPAIPWSSGASSDFDPQWPNTPPDPVVPPPGPGPAPPPVSPPVDLAGVGASVPAKLAAFGVGGVAGYMGLMALRDWVGRR